MKEIRKCLNCKVYTFREVCPYCGNKTKSIIPPKFSPEDKWGEYRRRMKKGLFI
ncbi:RNA-protein complex protein Nop10 [Nanoarchaeota archaeon NZ13-N]|uniref:Ribosome biogenesis protein Nop10 n=1 Tax=Candidatus Nanoclepta minutus TaxID=1940235 RepID=A0A397WP80_9ARCH|nr:MAG: RNA-protein complex protein Nop10 [Nanoarchaeota archaeon NZ13-N]RIB35309.1 MAG: ribosome biogenesis protein [Candidatus Nanoclepta minutus]